MVKCQMMCLSLFLPLSLCMHYLVFTHSAICLGKERHIGAWLHLYLIQAVRLQAFFQLQLSLNFISHVYCFIIISLQVQLTLTKFIQMVKSITILVFINPVSISRTGLSRNQPVSSVNCMSTTFFLVTDRPTDISCNRLVCNGMILCLKEQLTERNSKT